MKCYNSYYLLNLLKYKVKTTTQESRNKFNHGNKWPPQWRLWDTGETGEDTRRQKNVLCLFIIRINVVMIAILLKVSYRFRIIVIKIPITFFHRSTKNNIPNLIKVWNVINKVISVRKSNVWNITMPDLKYMTSAWFCLLSPCIQLGIRETVQFALRSP